MSNNDKLFDLILQLESTIRSIESMNNIDDDLRKKLVDLRRMASSMKTMTV